VSRDPDEPEPPPPVSSRTRTRSKLPTRSPIRDEGAAAEPDAASGPSGPRTRTRSITIGSLRGPEKSRTKTKEIPPVEREKTKLVIELDDPGELIGFLEQIIHVLRDNKSKKITLVIEE